LIEIKKAFLDFGFYVFAMTDDDGKYLLKTIEYKSSNESQRHRACGNELYTQMRLYDAIFAYNCALACGETSLDLALAYGNRSAAYFVAGKYAECLKSIKLARESGYPANKIEKLNERERKCEDMMKIDQQDPENDLWHYTKLSYPANEKIPWMIEGLEMRKTEKSGRGIYTTRDLKAGDIICVEESKLHVINDEGYFKCCNNCTKTNMMNLIPCLKTGEFI
jgi:tetratricopeptide (TPR) repeat protein